MANININERDWQKLFSQGQPGVPAPQQAGGILGLLAQNQSKPIMTAPPSFPRNAADMINPNTLNPYASGKYNGGNTPRPVASSQDNGLSQIMAQITKLLNEGPPDPQFAPVSLPEFNPTAYKGQATEIVNSQFDPVISDLMSQQKSTQTRAAGNQKAVGDMYNQLAAYMGEQGAEAGKQYDAAQLQSKNLYTDERDKMAGMYAADAAAQRAEAKRLGTEAFGTNDAIAQQTADKQFVAGQQSNQMQAQDAAFEQQQQAAQQYDRSMQGAAKSEGGEAQQQIIGQLEDYMNQSDTNIAGVKSQAAGSINDLMMKLAEGTYNRDLQNAQFGYQQQQDYIGNQNNLYDRNLDLMMKQLEMAQAAQGSTDTSKLNPWQQTATFAEQLAPGQGQDIVSALQQAMAQRQEISGVNPTGPDGQPIKMTPALFAQLIGDSQAGQGQDKNKLMMAAQELYRLLYGQ